MPRACTQQLSFSLSTAGSAISETVVFSLQVKTDAPDHERNSIRLETIEFRSNPLLNTSANEPE